MENLNEKKWLRISYMPGTGLGKDGRRLTGGEEHIRLSLEAAREGMVLLKNEDNLLPFAKGAKLAVFGKAQADYVKGGGGSGDVTVAYVRSLLDGLRIKSAEGKVTLYEPLSRFYEENVEAQRGEGKEPGMTKEPALPETLLAGAKENADIALITINRFSSEGWDRTGVPGDGDFYLSPEEEKMVSQVLSAFDRVAVVLNVGSVMDTLWFRGEKKIQAALLGWQAGMEGGLATADLLCGDACPNGRLADTFAGRFADYPSSATFAESDTYVTYDEDIYVGYRYFETIPGAAEKVCYPFGFGLSYTTFAITDRQGRVMEDGSLRFDCRVTNTGSFEGRQVVQLYAQAPQGKLGKAARVLVGFARTSSLKPGESQDLAIAVPLYRLASYDDEGAVRESAWLLEKGTYRFHMGENVRDAKEMNFVWELKEDQVMEQVSAKCVPCALKRRMLPDGSFREVKTPEKTWDRTPFEADKGTYDGEQPKETNWPVPESSKHWNPTTVGLIDVAEGKISLEDFMAGLSTEKLVHLLGGQPNRGVANTFGFGNLFWDGVPNAMTADGPAGLRIRPGCGVNTTAFPCACLLACTWDADLCEQVGAAAAEEVRENGIGVWLAPAINIHRTPLCGRNFEYYSEDPLLAGTLAAGLIKGVQSKGVAVSLKHFACNNKETNRRECDSRLSERALREIYLKAFEICVKEADPWTIMSSYNPVNGVRASENRELLTGILRDEWGFQGMVTTDWWTHGQQWREIAAGNDVKMGCGTPELTLEMIRQGKLSLEDVKISAERVLRLILKLA